MYNWLIKTLLMYFAAWASSAWALMLGIGVLHAEWLSAIPLMSFRASVGFTFVVVSATFLAIVLWRLVTAFLRWYDKVVNS